MKKLHINDIELLQTDVEGLQFSVFSVKRNHLEQAIIQAQAYDTAQGVHNANDTCLRGAPYAVLNKQKEFFKATQSKSF